MGVPHLPSWLTSSSRAEAAECVAEDEGAVVAVALPVSWVRSARFVPEIACENVRKNGDVRVQGIREPFGS